MTSHLDLRLDDWGKRWEAAETPGERQILLREALQMMDEMMGRLRCVLLDSIDPAEPTN